MMMKKQGRVIKGEWATDGEVTAWGGLALAERLACATRLWTDLDKRLPVRCKTAAGYDSATVAASVIHGLLSGAQGTYAAQGLREDEPLKRLLGLESGVPEEVTVWRALGQWGAEGGDAKIGVVQRTQTLRLLKLMPRLRLLVQGFFPIFGDATWLEVARDSDFEAMKDFDGAAKLMLSAVWAGPCLAAQGFAGEGQGEATTTMALLKPVWRDVVKPLRLCDSALFLMDSLYGDGPCLSQLEKFKGAHYVVGANKLSGVEAAAAEQPESQWEKTGKNEARGWIASGLCVHTYQAEDWEAKRVVVTLRYKRQGEMFWHYRSVFTNLASLQGRVKTMMQSQTISFARVVWRLYDHKQAMENQFKDALSDLGLHHPPCQQLARNTMFYALGALALNLSVGLRHIAMEGPECRMRLWRLRREFFAMAARVVAHARTTTAKLYCTSQRLRGLWSAAMSKLEAV